MVGDLGSIHRWFPGIVDCTLGEDDEGRFRTVELASGLHLTERIVTVDPILGTVDVIDLGDGTSLVVYGTDARPDVLALVIGGASGEALEHLEQLVSEGAGR